MVMICPYCDMEINEKQMEAEDGCCPECGVLITAGNVLSDGEDDDFYDDEDEFGDNDEFAEDDDFSDFDDFEEFDPMEEEFDDEPPKSKKRRH